MTITVEDGTGLAAAESYVSVANANTYWANRADTVWVAAALAEKEAALREATLYLDGVYNWIGTRVKSTQGLAWPRAYTGGLDSDNSEVLSTVVPAKVVKACCELALEALTTRLAATLDRGGLIKSESVGSLSVTYMDGAPSARSYPFVEMMLRRLITSDASSLTVDSVRA